MTESKSLKARRLEKFAWNLEHAKWGRFATELMPGQVQAICGVCGMDYFEQVDKAKHLETEHGAIVQVMTERGELLYDWRRA